MQIRQVECVGVGRGRAVFRHGRVVLKVPLNEEGLAANNLEAYRYQRGKGFDGDIAYARCRISPCGILVMVFLGPITKEERPDWADWVDCGQVGKTRFGKIVAYDYGEH